MNDDTTAPLPEGDKNYDSQTHRLRSRYDRSLNDNDPNIDDLDQSDLLPESAELDDGIGPDSFSYDSDEATLPDEQDNEVTSTGLDEIEMPTQGKDNLGDFIIDPQDELDSDEELDNLLKETESDLITDDIDLTEDLDDEDIDE